MKEELEASKQRAEREMRETRLRSLELKAAVARTSGHSAALRNDQALLAHNTKYNAASPTTGKAAGVRGDEKVAATAALTASAAHQRFVAEEVRKYRIRCYVLLSKLTN